MRSVFDSHVRRPLLAGLALAALTAASACGSATPVFPSNVDVPFASTDLVVGTGATAAAGQTLTVDYTGWLYDGSKPDNKGQQFGTSVGSTPFTFVLGVGQVIPGWDQGVPGMKVGGTRRLVLPPGLAYGGFQVGIIPPNSTIIFDITLNSIQ